MVLTKPDAGTAKKVLLKVLSTFELPLHKIISFFRDAKFKTLTMRPFFKEYLPTDTSNSDSNQELQRERKAGSKKRDVYLVEFMYRIPDYSQLLAKNLTDKCQKSDP